MLHYKEIVFCGKNFYIVAHTLIDNKNYKLCNSANVIVLAS